MRAALGLNLKVVESLVLVSMTVYMREPTAPPSFSGGCQLTVHVAEKGPKSLTVTACGAPGGTVHERDLYCLNNDKSSRLITADGDPRGSPLRSHTNMMGPKVHV